MFSRESQPKPSFATITGKGDNPTYTVLGKTIFVMYNHVSIYRMNIGSGNPSSCAVKRKLFTKKDVFNFRTRAFSADAAGL